MSDSGFIKKKPCGQKPHNKHTCGFNIWREVASACVNIISYETLRGWYRVVALGGDDLGDVGVPQHQVGVWAHGDAALAGVHVEDLGCVGAGHRHKLVLVHLTRHLESIRTRSENRIGTTVPLSFSPVRSDLLRAITFSTCLFNHSCSVRTFMFNSYSHLLMCVMMDMHFFCVHDCCDVLPSCLCHAAGACVLSNCSTVNI